MRIKTLAWLLTFDPTGVHPVFERNEVLHRVLNRIRWFILNAMAIFERPAGLLALVVAWERGRKRKDVSVFERALTNSRKEVPEVSVMAMRGVLLCECGRTGEGTALLREAASKHAALPLWNLLLRQLDYAENPHEVLQLAEAILQKESTNSYALTRKILALAKLQRRTEARETVESMLCRSNRYPKALWAWLGHHLTVHHAYDSAVMCLERATHSRAGKRSWLWTNLAICALARNEAPLALNHVQESRKRGGADDWLPCIEAEIRGERQYGIDCFESGSADRAYPFLAYESAQDNPLSMLYLGAVEADLHDERSWIDKAANAVHGRVEEDLVAQVHGATLWGVGDVEDGLAQMQHAIALNASAQNIMVYLSRLDWAHAATRIGEIVALSEILVKEWPDRCDAHDLRAQALRGAGRLPEAQTHAQRAVDLDPQDAYAHYTLACVLAERASWSEARRSFAKALDLGYEPPADAWQAIGECWQKLGERAKAREALSKSLELDPANAEAGRVLGEPGHA